MLVLLVCYKPGYDAYSDVIGTSLAADGDGDYDDDANCFPCKT